MMSRPPLTSRASRAITALTLFACVAASSAQPAGNKSEFPKASNADDFGCLKCHGGIEAIGAKMNDVGCTICHKGSDSAAEKEAAHAGLISDPGNLVSAKKTCGLCHPTQFKSLLKSLHATSAGIISGTRYAWAAQNPKGSFYGVKDAAEDPAADSELPLLPTFEQSGEHVDDFLRKNCLRCHAWSAGPRHPGEFHSAGCSACHMLTSADGLARGGDPTISKEIPGHSTRHMLTRKVPTQQCLRCHNRGMGPGSAFIGSIASLPGSASPRTALRADIHHERGMHCIDCHTGQELHGDGRLHGKKEDALEIRCESCHGSPEARGSLMTSRGRKIENLKIKDGRVMLISKVTGAEHPVTQLKDLRDSGKLHPSMSIPAHMKSLECYACHSRWAPQFYGARIVRDDRGDDIDQLSGETSIGKWQETFSYVRWESPVLGINARGKVSPFVPGSQAAFTHIDKNGETVENGKIHTAFDGVSGLSHTPVQPHTVSKESRSCADCHSNPKSVGLGSGIFDPGRNGIAAAFGLDRIVDENGQPLQSISTEGARPFNKQELERILRVDTCLSCHAEQAKPGVWESVTDLTGFAKTDPKHQAILKGLLPKKPPPPPAAPVPTADPAAAPAPEIRK